MTSMGEGQTQANREISHSMYLKTGDPGPQGGGTYTGDSNENILKMYENIFGPAGRDIKLDQQRHKRHQRWHLPDALKGSNQYLTDRVDGLITDSTNSPFTRNILPYVYLENPDQKLKWNVYSFDEGIASRVPYEAAARVLPQSKRSFAGYTVRQGLAIAMEHNFMMSASGRENFRNQLTQLVGSIQMTNDIDVTVALLTAPSHQRHMDEKYKDSSRTTTQHCRQFVDLFGIMQKVPNALDILIEDAKNNLKSWGSAPPTFMLTNSALTTQLTMLPEKTNYLTNGPDGKKLLAQGPDLPSYRGLSFIPSRKFSLDSGEAPRDLLRRRVRVAEYHRIPYKPGIETQEFEFYDQSRDSFFRLSYAELVKLSQLHSESGDSDGTGGMDVDGPNGPNGPNGPKRKEYSSGTWSMQADKNTKTMRLSPHTPKTSMKSVGFTTTPVQIITTPITCTHNAHEAHVEHSGLQDSSGGDGRMRDSHMVAPYPTTNFGFEVEDKFWNDVNYFKEFSLQKMGQKEGPPNCLFLPHLIFDQELGKCQLPILDPSLPENHVNLHESGVVNYSGKMLLGTPNRLLHGVAHCRHYSEQFGGGLFNENLMNNAVEGKVTRGWDLMTEEGHIGDVARGARGLVAEIAEALKLKTELISNLISSIESGTGQILDADDAPEIKKILKTKGVYDMSGLSDEDKKSISEILLGGMSIEGILAEDKVLKIFPNIAHDLEQLTQGKITEAMKDYYVGKLFSEMNTDVDTESLRNIANSCVQRYETVLTRWAHDIAMDNMNGNANNSSHARHDFEKIKDDLLLHVTLNVLATVRVDKIKSRSDDDPTTLNQKQQDFAVNIIYHFLQKLPRCPNIHVGQRVPLRQADYESPCGIDQNVLILQHLAANIDIDAATCKNLMSNCNYNMPGIDTFFQVQDKSAKSKLASLVYAEFGPPVKEQNEQGGEILLPNPMKYTEYKLEEIQRFACAVAEAVKHNSFDKNMGTRKIWERFANIIVPSAGDDPSGDFFTGKADRFQYVIPSYVSKNKGDNEFCGREKKFYERPLYDLETAHFLDNGSKFTQVRPTKEKYTIEASEYYGYGQGALLANALKSSSRMQEGSTVNSEGRFSTGSGVEKISHNYVPAVVKYPWLSILKGNQPQLRVVPQIIVTSKNRPEKNEDRICDDESCGQVHQAARWIEDNATAVYQHFLLCLLERFFRDGARHLACHTYLDGNNLYHLPISLKHGPELPYNSNWPDWDRNAAGGGAGGLGGAYGKQDIVILRPNIEHEMLGVVMGRGGTQELGATFWGQTELSCYDDAQHGIWGMSYKYHERAIVTNERNLVRVYDVAFDGYNGGMDQKVVDWNSTDSVNEFRNKTYDRTMPYHGPSMMVMSFPHNQKISQKSWPNPIAFHPHGITSPNPEKGPLPADIGEHSVFSSRNPSICDQAIEAKFKRYLDRLDMHYWVGVEQESRPAGEMCLSNEASQNLLAFEGTMRTYNADGRMVHETHGSGHLGPSYVGVASVREGRGVQNANAAPTMHRLI